MFVGGYRGQLAILVPVIVYVVAKKGGVMNIVISAQEAIQKPEVVTLIKELSRYGLAVFVPHEHPPEGGFIPLEQNRVQYESGSRVSFVNRDDSRLNDAAEVGWRWGDNQVEVVAACHVPHY